MKSEAKLKSIHEELYKDGKSVDQLIKEYPQLKEPLEQAREGIEEQRQKMEWLYKKGIFEETKYYEEKLGEVVDHLQPTLKALTDADRSFSYKEGIGPMQFTVQVTPTIKSVMVSLRGVQSDIENIISTKKDLLISSLITPQSKMALDITEVKAMTRQTLEKQTQYDKPINLNGRANFVRDQNETRGILYLNQKEILFSGLRCELVDFFCHEKVNNWKTYYDLPDHLRNKTTIEKFRKAIREINRRTAGITEGSFPQIIKVKDGDSRYKQANYYKWGL